MPLSPSAQKVQDALAAAGFAHQIVEFPQTTRSSAEAAAAIGCEAGDIAKSILFRAANSGQPVMVIASGTNRIDERKVASLLGEKLKKADPDFVRAATGYAIGGVPPLGHASKIRVFLDRDLQKRSRIWAAAGTPNAVFPLSFDDLIRMTAGEAGDIRQD
jgi:prolyl-tRNA editing enzyme YbaK/EbsC (Cys-tRNA(Pro) deacylase)